MEGGTMKAKSTARWIGLVGIAIALTLFLASSAAHAEDDTIGADEYRISCMSCHGVGGAWRWCIGQVSYCQTN
jgi:mono/diheme cytochrome c family protein